MPLPGAVHRVERLIGRYGGPFVLAGRFLGWIRAVLMLTAGAMGLPYRRFWPWELLGAAAWSAWWLGVGAAGGLLTERFGDLSVWSRALLVLSLLVGGAVAWRFRARLRQLLREAPEGA